MRLVLVLVVCLLLPGCATLTAGAIGGAIALGAASAVGSRVGERVMDDAYDRFRCRNLRTLQQRDDCARMRGALR